MTMKKRYPQGIMATACVPWTDDFKFDEAMFRREVDVLCDNKIGNIYLFGTAGEGYAISDSQFHDIVSAFTDQVKGRDGVAPMVGVICLSPDDILRRIEDAAKADVQNFQISFPSWGAVSKTEAASYFHYICDRFPECHFMHYNNGLRSRVKVTAEQYVHLSEEIPNLVAVKHTAATLNEIVDIMKRDLPLQFFFMEGAFGYASLFGEASLLISLCNINYSIARRYLQAGMDKDLETIAILDKEFHTCSALLSRLPTGKMDGAYDKLFVKYSIPDFPQRLFPPYEGITDGQFKEIDKMIRTELPQWF